MKAVASKLLVLGLVAGMTACNDDETELRCDVATAVAPPINESFTVRVGDSVLVDGGLQLQFIAVDADSRCPSDVECVSAGSAVVSLRAQADDRDPENFTLETGNDRSEVIGFDDGFYQVALDGLAPTPISTRRIAADGYCASFTVVKALQ